ncbi:regucalcin-like isoform X2 [Anoplophora glabripennis]|uniref:regucalcin-like isoform X2 n=1 Tax=Anoplophora glabripennis TaxID=217634 RepID=UPI000874265A|nr:regucalcin-like isoform X2 [Anoplophora glabripennis]
MSSKVEVLAITEPVQHSEGPFCDVNNEVLYYVDTFQATAFRYNLKTAKRSSYKLDGHNSIAVVIPSGENQDEFIVGADRCLYRMIWPDCENVEATLEKLLKVEDEKPTNQFNDGKVDSRGRLWLGTLTRNKDLSVAPNGGSLYMFGSEDLQNFEEKVPNTSISNGLAWSSDGKRFYFIDSAPRLVYGYDYHEETGKIGGEKVVFDLHDHPHLKGLPDGMTIDTSDNLWIALFGGHSVININPRTSKIIREIKMPVTYVTSVCFGGPNLDVLFVTSSRLHLNDAQVKEEPLAGCVFAVSNLGVKGLPNNRFNTTYY